MKMLAVLFMLGLLLQVGTVQAANLPGCGTGAAAAVSPTTTCPTGVTNSIPAVQLDKYLKDNAFKPNNIEQVVPVPPAQPVQTGGVASIPAVKLKDYKKDNEFKADKIKQYVPVPPAQTSTTGAAATPSCPVIQPIITPAPQVKIMPGPTGGAAPQGKTIKGLW